MKTTGMGNAMQAFQSIPVAFYQLMLPTLFAIAFFSGVSHSMQ
jgi:hypothetical protein